MPTPDRFRRRYAAAEEAASMAHRPHVLTLPIEMVRPRRKVLSIRPSSNRKVRR